MQHSVVQALRWSVSLRCHATRNDLETCDTCASDLVTSRSCTWQNDSSCLESYYIQLGSHRTGSVSDGFEYAIESIATQCPGAKHPIASLPHAYVRQRIPGIQRLLFKSH